ncbi:MAG: isoprenylcysteine carboxylmethyltransferase family protein [Bacteroidales bacterium]|nr:isoprenylcysteine carboxylmethyltransferase family protein [Bacteroidales bacterium]
MMNKGNKMILGYIAGGLLVVGLMPSIIYLLTWLMDKFFRLELFHNLVVQEIVIVLLLIVGIIFGIWSLVAQNAIGEGGPLEIGNIEISPKTEHLVVTGPYKYTRNPMLFGTFLMYLAFAFFINSATSLILVCAIIIFMLTVVVKMEEKRLLKDFGNQYEEYRKKVSKFIPWFQREKDIKMI